MRVMRYEARITAYDMLDQVCVAAVLFSTPELETATPVPVLKTVVTLAGEGITDPHLWLRDALCALAETL